MQGVGGDVWVCGCGSDLITADSCLINGVDTCVPNANVGTSVLCLCVPVSVTTMGQQHSCRSAINVLLQLQWLVDLSKSQSVASCTIQLCEKCCMINRYFFLLMVFLLTYSWYFYLLTRGIYSYQYCLDTSAQTEYRNIETCA